MERSLPYKIEIDREACMGAGVCVLYATNTFELDEHAKSTVRDAAGDPLDRIQTAAEGCPNRAILVVLIDGT